MSDKSPFPKTVKAGLPKLSDLPNGWIQAPLSDFLVEIKRPVSINPNAYYSLITVKRARGGVEHRSRLLGKDILVKSQFLVRDGDFVISKRQIVHGACGLVKAEQDGAIVSNEYAVFDAKENFDLVFLSYLSASLYFQQTCFHSSIGVHIEKMLFKTEVWLGWTFNVPPLFEQKRIATIIATWDEAIELTESLLANSQHRKKALMQKLLTGKLRFKGFDSSFSWRELGQCVDVDKESLNSKTDPKFKFKYISLSNVEDGGISSNLEQFEFGSSPSRARRVLKEGDILMANVRPGLQGFARVGFDFKDCIASTGFSVLSPKSGFDGGYIYHYLFSNVISQQVDALVVGTNYPAINSSDVKRLKIYLPKLKEQQQISTVLSTADEEIDVLSAQIDCLRQEKQALMQKLFTGKVRVKVEP